MQQQGFYQEPQMQYNQQYNQNVLNPANQYMQNVEPHQQMQQIQQMQPMQPVQTVPPARIVEPEKPKAPIPEEHIHLKTVLDELQSHCFENAKNPVSKFNIYF